MKLPIYEKPHAKPDELLKHHQEKGLDVPNTAAAAEMIRLIGHDRLRIYLLSRRETEHPDKPYYPGTSFQDIQKIYECDAEIRNICFSGASEFEIRLRNRISERLSEKFGSHPYSNLNAFKCRKSRRAANRHFKDACENARKRKDRRIIHYEENYGGPPLPPIWTLKEFLSFGQTARILQTLSGSVFTKVAADFGLPSKRKILDSWVKAVVDIRNICAHHDRLFNRSFSTPASFTANGKTIPAADFPRQKLRASLQCLDYMMNACHTPINIEDAVREILTRYPEVKLAEVGY